MDVTGTLLLVSSNLGLLADSNCLLSLSTNEFETLLSIAIATHHFKQVACLLMLDFCEVCGPGQNHMWGM